MAPKNSELLRANSEPIPGAARLHSGCCPVSFRLLPGFIPGIARFRSGCCPVSFRESSGLTPIFKHCCGKHEALLKPFLRTIESNLKPICGIMNPF